jgi:hypothetical protein
MTADPFGVGCPVVEPGAVPLDGSLVALRGGPAPHYRRVFPDWASYLAHCNGPCTVDDSRRSSRDPERGSFYGGIDYADANEHAVNGWTGLDAKVAELSRPLKRAVVDEVKPKWTSQWARRGNIAHVGRVLEGNPNCWRRRRRVQTPTRLRPVRLMLGASVNSGTETDALAARACYVIALVDSLTRAGRPCEIWLYYGQRSSRHVGSKTEKPRADRIVRFKRAEERLDRGKLAFAIGHVGCPRRLDFSAREREPDALKRPMGYMPLEGYGGTADPERVDQFADVLLGNARSYQWIDPEETAKMVKDQLRELGVAIREG